MRQDAKGPRRIRPDGALPLQTHGMWPFHFQTGGRTHNWSLRYKPLERPVHRVSPECQNARYFFLLMH